MIIQPLYKQNVLSYTQINYLHTFLEDFILFLVLVRLKIKGKNNPSEPVLYSILNPWKIYLSVRWYFEPHGIYQVKLLWNIEPSSYDTMNPIFWWKWGSSIYHDGVQNTVTDIWLQGQNTLWYIELGSIFQGFKIPYDTSSLGFVFTFYTSSEISLNRN